MKNKMVGFIVALFTMMLLNNLNAQVSNFTNQLNCSVVIGLTFFDSGGNTCGFVSSITVGAGGSVNTPAPSSCSGLSTATSAGCLLTSVAGTPLGSPIFLMPGNTVPGVPVSGIATTCATGASADFFANGGNFNYKIE